MRTQLYTAFGFLSAIILLAGVSQHTELPLQEFFRIPVVHAQADGGDMGGGACDATGSDMGGGACDTGGSGDTGQGGGSDDGVDGGEDTHEGETQLPGTQLTIVGVGCNVSGPFVTVSVSPVGDASEFQVDIVTSLNDPQGSRVGSKVGIPREGGTYNISFPNINGVHYHAVEYAYRDGWWVYANVSDHFLAPNCAPVTWTTYCTGGSDPNGNNWQWWQYSNTSPVQYQYLRAGDGTCMPPVVGGMTGTIAVSPPNTCAIASGANTCSANVTWSTQNAQSSVAQAAGPLWPSGANIDGPTTNASGSTWHNLPAGSYVFVVHGYNGTDWIELHRISYVVTAQPDLTVSGITPTSAIAGTPTTFSATVINTGTGSTGIGFQNFYQVRSNTTATAPQNIFTKLFNIAHAAEVITDLAASNMSALAAGGSGVATQSYTFPQTGTYGIRVCADKANSGDTVGVIAESDETNNCGGWTDVNVTEVCTVGGACSVSNACNYATGTYNSSCNCSATVPPVPATYGNPCTSSANVCGQTNSGTITCNGTCSAASPSDSLCLPTVTLSADPMRVRKDTSTKLTWSSNNATACTLTGQNGFSSTALSGTDVDSDPLDAQTKFTLTCSNTYSPPSVSASVIVNLLPSYIEQ